MVLDDPQLNHSAQPGDGALPFPRRMRAILLLGLLCWALVAAVIALLIS